MWYFLDCAVQGRGHIQDNIPCQDKTYSLNLNDVYVITLADGAGSAKYSEFGAESTVKVVSQNLANNFDIYYQNQDAEQVKKELIDAILIELKKLSLDFDCKLVELASTLLCVAVKKDKFIIAHLGDGVIGYVKNEEIKVASVPANGEFINTTIFTTSNNAHTSLNLIKGELNGIKGFVLMSDGSADSLYDKRQLKISNIIKKLMELSTQSNLDLLKESLFQSFQESVCKKTLDDCSIALLTYTDSDFDGFSALSEKEQYLKLEIPLDIRHRKNFKNNKILLEYLLTKRTMKEIVTKMHIKEKYLYKKINRLIRKGLIIKNDDSFQTLIKF